MKKKKRTLKKKKFKKKFKYLFIIFIILIIIITGLIIFSKKQNTNVSKKKKTIKDVYYNKCNKLDYCNNKNINRYLAYHKKNDDLNFEDIVTRVNLNLDYSFYTHTKKAKDLNKDYILVNKYYYLDENYIPNNLENIPEEYSRSGMKLVSSAKEAFVKLARDARKNNTPVIAMSSFRSYDYQVDLYDRYKRKEGKNAADTYSARPGFSEHQTGLCVDVYDGEIDYTSFEKSDSFKWMSDNAYKYGFILRYPKGKDSITGYQYESWHYRYVGQKIAKYIKENDITYDEYYAKFIENNY